MVAQGAVTAMAPEQSSQTEPVSPIRTPELSQERQSQPPSVQQQSVQPNGEQPAPFTSYPGAYGQQFVPYPHRPGGTLHPQPQPQQIQQAYAVVGASAPPEKQSWKITKDVGHVLALIISVVGIGISFSAVNTPNGYTDSYDYIDPSILAMAGGPLFCVAFLWSLAELVTRCCRGFRAGIHPGAHVGMCLVILLGAVAVGVLLAILLAITVQDCADYASNYRSQRTCTLGGKPKFIAVVVLSLLLAVVEFFLFVAGCIDTHRRNRIPPAVRQVPIHQAGENGQGVNMPDTALPQKQSWKITKDVAHVVVIIISIIGAGMAFSRINPSLDYTRYYDGTGESEAFGSIFIIAAVWSIAELITRFCHSWKSGIHPGAHVGISLCLWLATLTIAIMFTVVLIQTTGDRNDGCYPDDRYGVSAQCQTYRDEPIFVGVLVLSFLLFVAEFFLFIGACVDTHRLNKIKHTIVVAPAGYWQPPPQGWYPPPPMQPQQPVTSEKGILAANENYQPQHNIAEFYSPGHNGGQPQQQQQPRHNVTEFYSPGTAV